jgi:hypothetical protein
VLGYNYWKEICRIVSSVDVIKGVSMIRVYFGPISETEIDKILNTIIER